MAVGTIVASATVDQKTLRFLYRTTLPGTSFMALKFPDFIGRGVAKYGFLLLGKDHVLNTPVFSFYQSIPLWMTVWEFAVLEQNNTVWYYLPDNSPLGRSVDVELYLF